MSDCDTAGYDPFVTNADADILSEFSGCTSALNKEKVTQFVLGVASDGSGPSIFVPGVLLLYPCTQY